MKKFGDKRSVVSASVKCWRGTTIAQGSFQNTTCQYAERKHFRFGIMQTMGNNDEKWYEILNLSCPTRLIHADMNEPGQA